jgi:hypothetical protein
MIFSSNLSVLPHQGMANCRKRNASLEEILSGVRARDQRFDITAQFHHCFLFGEPTRLYA